MLGIGQNLVAPLLVLKTDKAKVMLRPKVSRPISLGVKHPSAAETRFLLLSESLLMWSAFSDEREGLSFTTAASPRQRSHSLVRPSTASDSRLHKPGGPGPRIHIPQEQSDPVTPPRTEFPFRRFLRLAALWWRYSNPPPHGDFKD
jgi:hypothetical protein